MANTDAREVRPSAYRWLVFALLAAAYFMVYFHRTSPAVVALDMMADLKAGATLMGLLGSAYFYPYALMQIPAGLLSDSWGPRKTITAFFVLAGVASILFGQVATAGQAVIARALVGLGVSMLFVPTMKILTGWFRPAEFARMMGILMAIGGFGALFSSAPLAYLSTVLGWRGSFGAIGVVTLVLAGAIWIFVRNRPEDKGLPPAVERAPEKSAGPAIGIWQGLRMVLGEWRFWPLAIWFLLGVSIFFAFGGLWGGPYLMQVHGLTKPQAGNVLTMLFVGLIVGSPSLSWFSDNVFHSRKKLIVFSSAVVLVLSALLAAFPASLPIWFLYIWCLLLGIFGSAIVIIGFTSTKELFPVEIAGTSTGLVNLFPFLGGALLQVIVGLVLESQGQVEGAFTVQAYRMGFMVFLVSAAISFTASLFVKETLVRD